MVDVEEVVAIEPKKYAHPCLVGATHLFDTISDFLQPGGGHCIHHGGRCLDAATLANTHILIAGFPCAGFSSQRVGRFSPGRWPE